MLQKIPRNLYNLLVSSLDERQEREAGGLSRRRARSPDQGKKSSTRYETGKSYVFRIWYFVNIIVICNRVVTSSSAHSPCSGSSMMSI